jgi:hypothetical protein
MKTLAVVGRAVAIGLLITGCASSRVSSLPTSSSVRTAPIQVIALDPNGQLLCEAVGVELANKGYTIIDSAATAKLLSSLGVGPAQMQQPQALSKMRAEGIHAVLVVKAAGGYDMQPQSASVRLSSTQGGQTIAGLTWQNGYGGMAGSVADRMMRKGLTDAAAEIADALQARLQ